jgi:hypothetical protein
MVKPRGKHVFDPERVARAVRQANAFGPVYLSLMKDKEAWPKRASPREPKVKT